MEPEVDNVEAEVDDVEAPAAPAKAAPNPQKPAPAGTNWEVQYKRLQGTLDKRVAEVVALKQERETLVDAHEQALSELRNGEKSASKQLADLQTQHQTLTARTATLEHRETVANLLNSEEFANQPALRALHAKGVLRTEGLEGEGLLENLREMAAALAGVASTAAREGIAGGTPEAPAGGKVRPGATAKDLKIQLRDIASQGLLGSAEHRAVEAAYYEAVSKEGLDKAPDQWGAL